MSDCMWMYGNPDTGLVDINVVVSTPPLQWSEPVSLAKAVADLEKLMRHSKRTGQHSNGTFLLKVPAKAQTPERYSTLHEALDALKRAEFDEFMRQRKAHRTKPVAAAKHNFDERDVAATLPRVATAALAMQQVENVKNPGAARGATVALAMQVENEKDASHHDCAPRAATVALAMQIGDGVVGFIHQARTSLRESLLVCVSDRPGKRQDKTSLQDMQWKGHDQCIKTPGTVYRDTIFER